MAFELAAPPGWKKTVIPKIGGNTRKNDEIIFTAPTGEEFTTKKQLEQYLKLNPAGPSLLDFYWGSSETPRRSARISAKAKAPPSLSPESEPPKKRHRKSSSSKKNSQGNRAEKANDSATGDPEKDRSDAVLTIENEDETLELKRGLSKEFEDEKKDETQESQMDMKENKDVKKDATQTAEDRAESASFENTNAGEDVEIAEDPEHEKKKPEEPGKDPLIEIAADCSDVVPKADKDGKRDETHSADGKPESAPSGQTNVPEDVKIAEDPEHEKNTEDPAIEPWIEIATDDSVVVPKDGKDEIWIADDKTGSASSEQTNVGEDLKMAEGAEHEKNAKEPAEELWTKIAVDDKTGNASSEQTNVGEDIKMAEGAEHEKNAKEPAEELWTKIAVDGSNLFPKDHKNEMEDETQTAADKAENAPSEQTNVWDVVEMAEDIKHENTKEPPKVPSIEIAADSFDVLSKDDKDSPATENHDDTKDKLASTVGDKLNEAEEEKHEQQPARAVEDHINLLNNVKG